MLQRWKYKRTMLVSVLLILALVCCSACGGSKTSKSSTKSDNTKTEKTEESAQKDATETETSEDEDVAADVDPVTMYATNKVNVRTKPSTDSDVISKLNRGDSVETYGEEDGWTRVQIDGTYYYVSSEYLSTEDFSLGSLRTHG